VERSEIPPDDSDRDDDPDGEPHLPAPEQAGDRDGSERRDRDEQEAKRVGL
jgi:hypothetical protein